MTTQVILTDAILTTARAAFAKGPKDFDAYCVLIKGVTGYEPVAFKAAFEMARQKAERNDSARAIGLECDGYSVTKKLLKILKMGTEHVNKFSIKEVKDGDTITVPGFTPRLTFVLEYVPAGKVGDKEVAEHGILKLISGRVATRSSGKVGGNSRISAFGACERGIKAGDSFKILKADGGYKVNGRYVASRVNGGLGAFILKAFPSSKTAGILKDYGYSLK